MPANPVLKEATFQQEISAARQHWGSPPPGAFAGSRGSNEGPPTSAGGYATMTANGTATATGILLLLLTIFGGIGYSQVEITSRTVLRGGQAVVQNTTAMPGFFLPCMIVGFLLALSSGFFPKAARFTGPIYAVLMGLAVGVISAIYDVQTQGVALQAVGATLAVALVMWFLFTTRIIRVTNKLRMIVVGATGGIFLLYLTAMIFSLFGTNIRFWREPTPLGIGISLLIVGVAAFNLLLDFDFVERATAMGSPKYMEWYAAFGITVTLVWLYLELLRLLSMLNRR